MPRHLITIVGNLQIDRGNILGTAGSYSHVFRGIFNGEEVAVKRVQLFDLNHTLNVEDRELKINQKLSRLNHPNIVQFKHYEEDDDFR
jgi:serine/threonine protein kinase